MRLKLYRAPAMAEAMARDLGPQGVHVAYLVIDAVIDLEWTRKRWPETAYSTTSVVL